MALDLEGGDFTDDQAAITSAYKDVRDLLASSDRRGRCRRHWRMDVRDEHGTTVFSLPFAHALEADLLRAA